MTDPRPVPFRPDRRLLLGSAASLVAGAALPSPHERARAERSAPRRVLFQGDSITDAGRDRERSGANDAAALGSGYAFLASAGLLARAGEDELEIWNRGVSGDRVRELEARWQADCLDIDPDLLSVLIGVNDHWRTVDGVAETKPEEYEGRLRALLNTSKKALHPVQLVVCEPFALERGYVTEAWYPTFNEFRAAARRVAEDVGAIFVPFQEVFDRACSLAPAERWAPDGVHPSADGAALMAQAWLDAVG